MSFLHLRHKSSSILYSLKYKRSPVSHYPRLEPFCPTLIPTYLVSGSSLPFGSLKPKGHHYFSNYLKENYQKFQHSDTHNTSVYILKLWEIEDIYYHTSDPLPVTLNLLFQTLREKWYLIRIHDDWIMSNMCHVIYFPSYPISTSLVVKICQTFATIET